MRKRGKNGERTTVMRAAKRLKKTLKKVEKEGNQQREKLAAKNEEMGQPNREKDSCKN